MKSTQVPNKLLKPMRVFLVPFKFAGDSSLITVSTTVQSRPRGLARRYKPHTPEVRSNKYEVFETLVII